MFLTRNCCRLLKVLLLTIIISMLFILQFSFHNNHSPIVNFNVYHPTTEKSQNNLSLSTINYTMRPDKIPRDLHHPHNCAKTENSRYFSDDQSMNFRCPHPTLSQHCYSYGNLSAFNKCCKFHTYGKHNQEDVLECSKKSEAWNLSKYRRKSSFMHWMFIGDSHIRNIFEVLIRRLEGPLLKYRKASYREGLWRPMETLKVAKYQGIPITVKHLTAPLIFTFIWSPFLRLIPNLTSKWLMENNAPTLVLMGSALHWMRETMEIYNESPEKASNVYKEHLMNIAPFLKRLTALALVVFKLLDHLPESTNNITNIDLYNNIATKVLPNEVEIWNSNIPLSDLYIKECRKIIRDTPETKQWRCKDEKHTGYIIIEKYVDMLINYGCNRFLSLNKSYCI